MRKMGSILSVALLASLAAPVVVRGQTHTAPPEPDASATHSGCVNTPTDNHSANVLCSSQVQIVPIPGAVGAAAYCRKVSGGLDVKLWNPAKVAKAPVSVSVDFGGTPPVTNQSHSPHISPNGIVDVVVPMPNTSACSSLGCSFTISAFDPHGTVQASGTCIG